MVKKWLNKKVAVGLLATSVVLAGCSSTNNETVATVNGEKITKDELYEILVNSSGSDAINALIDEKVVAMEIKKEKITIPEDEIDAETKKFMEEVGGEEAFNDMLKENDISASDFKDDIIQYLSIRKLMEPLVDVTDEEIETYFKENKETFGTPEQVEARHILVEDEALANDLYKQLKDGADFAELAKEHSTDGSAAMGGDLGFFPRGQMVPEFDEKSFEMEVGEISGPVKSQFGYHIIEKLAVKEATEATLENHKEDIKESLFEDKMQTEYAAWIDEKRGEYDIENNLLSE